MEHKRERDAATDALPRPERRGLGIILRCRGARTDPSEFRFAEGTITVGAGNTAAFVIDDTTVSRAHAEFTVVREGVHVRDLGSRNGTFYLGQRVESLTVQPGTKLLLGGVEISVEPDLDALGTSPKSSHTPSDAAPRSYGELIGDSPAMRHLFAVLGRLEGSLVSVLITGPSGAGKELIARALHDRSIVHTGPLITKNCAAMSKELVQSELFGHKRGAFTGAVEARIGAFEAAHGGTLFLDEVGELPLEVQPILLRALEQGEISPVGSNEVKKVKVRVVTATNRDLVREAAEGRFREDLFYRLAVVTLAVPALSQRPEDIPLLANHFAREVGIPSIPADILERFKKHTWPGNARELRNAVQAYSALGTLLEPAARPTGDQLGAAMRQRVNFDQPFQAQKEAVTDAFTQTYLEDLLQHTAGNQSEAARISGIERSYLRKLMAKHGLGK